MDAGQGYNYDSIMHYGAYAFSSNGQQVMYPKQPNVILTDPYDKQHMEESDAIQIRQIYNC